MNTNDQNINPVAVDPNAAAAAAVRAAVAGITFAGIKTRVLGTLSVPWETFAAVPAHQNQRFTPLHAAKLVSSGVLAEPVASHLNVAAVLVGDLDECAAQFASLGVGVLGLPNARKLDGHSRTRAQSDGLAPKPDAVNVTVYAAENAAESARLYVTFDSSVSSKKVSDKAQSALLTAGMQPQSRLFQSGAGVVQAMRMASAIIDEGTLELPTVNRKVRFGENVPLDALVAHLVPGVNEARRHMEALLALDAVDIAPKDMPATAPALAAYLALYAKHGEKAIEFVSKVKARDGVSGDGRMDGVYAAATILDHIRLKHGRKKGAEKSQAVVSAILNGMTAWLAGDTYEAGKYPMHASIITSLFEPERREAERARAASAREAVDSSSESVAV